MKQLLSLSLFLLPCLALAQYPSNGNQKITLGEQTTADGLVYRGVAATDTVRKPSIDTMAYMVLDTTTNIIWHYKKATSNAWTRVGGSISSGVTGVLPVANGGTGATSFSANNYLIKTNSSNVFDISAVYEIDGNVGIGTTSPSAYSSRTSLTLNNNTIGGLIDFKTNNVRIGTMFNDNETFNLGSIGNIPFLIRANGVEKMRITSSGEVWIGYTSDNGEYPLQVNGQIFATNATIATSDEKFKENITPLNKGLEIVSKLKPVTFNFISDTENNFSEYEEVGFIAQDVDRALSTETFSKSIVKSADDSEPTSTMGLATQNLIPILVKAIQEQQALIKALEQRILILENK
jgi:hypothetical protein